MEVAMLRTIMVLLHRRHTPVIFYQDQWAEVVPSRAPRAALEGCSSMQTVPPGFFRKRGRTTREVNLTPCTRTINYRGGCSSASFFFKKSSSSCCVSSAGTGGGTTAGPRSHHHNLAKQGYHSNHGNHHHHHSPSTQHSHPPLHVSSSVSSHGLGIQEGRKRGRRKRSSTAAVNACSSPKRRSFPGIGSNGHSSGSPLNINSMVRSPVLLFTF